MADTPTSEQTTPNPGPQPAIDPKAIADAVGATVRDAMAQSRAEDLRQARAREAAARRPEPSTNPLAAAIAPIVEPAFRALATATAGAQDAAMFYVEHPEALKHKKAVEDGFNTLIDQGTPMTRDAVWKWYKGEHQAEFVEEEIKSREARAKAAEQAGTVGPGGPTRLENTPTAADPHTMTDEDLTKAMSGVAF